MAKIPVRSFKKFIVLPGIGVAAISMIASGVAHHQARQEEYARLCKNQSTGKRVDDSECDDDTGSGSSSSHGYSRTSRWYWQPARSNKGRVPKVGETLSGGSDSAPKYGTVYKNVPSDGGSFEDAYTKAKGSDTYSRGKITSSKSGGKSSSSSGKGGFGGGSKSGGSSGS